MSKIVASKKKLKSNMGKKLKEPAKCFDDQNLNKIPIYRFVQKYQRYRINQTNRVTGTSKGREDT